MSEREARTVVDYDRAERKRRALSRLSRLARWSDAAAARAEAVGELLNLIDDDEVRAAFERI